MYCKASNEEYHVYILNFFAYRLVTSARAHFLAGHIRLNYHFIRIALPTRQKFVQVARYYAVYNPANETNP